MFDGKPVFNSGSKKTKGEIFLFNKIKKIIITTLILGALSASASAAELSDWAKDDYINASSSQLVPFSVGSQSMSNNITREQLCELIVNTYEKISGEKIPEYNEKPFADCDNQVVINAYGAGLVGGTGSDTFSPDTPVTREEMAKMINNMLAATNLDIKLSMADDTILNGFSDSGEISEWARPAMATMLNHSLVNGVEGQLLPTGNATCEQAIVAVSRAYNAFKVNTDEIAIGQMASVISPVEASNIEGGDISVAWTPVAGAMSYKVVLRNENAEIIGVYETFLTTQEIKGKDLTTGEYNITVVSVMSTGKEVFSIPVTVKYINPESLVLAPSSNSGMLKFDSIPKIAEVSPKITSIFTEAEKYLGTPYLYGGTTPAGFDCSGFVQYVFKNNGISLKRTSRDQYANNGTFIEKAELKPGDLVFFGSGGVVGHVGIYAGDGQMIHSPSTGKSITYTSIESNYYKSHYIGAKRIIE